MEGSNFQCSARLPAFCGERLWPIGGSKCINTDKSWCACARAIQTGIGAGLRGGLGPGPLPEPEKIIAALLARIGSLEQALAVELAKPRPLVLPDLISRPCKIQIDAWLVGIFEADRITLAARIFAEPDRRISVNQDARNANAKRPRRPKRIIARINQRML